VAVRERWEGSHAGTRGYPRTPPGPAAAPLTPVRAGAALVPVACFVALCRPGNGPAGAEGTEH
jgi:hypothetical protein